MRYFIIIFLVGFWSCQDEDVSPSGSESIVKYYGAFYRQSAADIVTVGQRRYILGTSNSFGKGSNDIYLVVTDLSGNEFFSKKIGSDAAEETAVNMVAVEDGLVILGNGEDESKRKTPYLLKIDFNGNSIQKNFIQLSNSFANHLAMVDEDQFIISGYTGGLSVGSESERDLFVYNAKLDGRSNWDGVFQRTFSGKDEAVKAHVLPSQAIIVFVNALEVGRGTIGKTPDVLVLYLGNQLVDGVRSPESGGFTLAKYGGLGEDIFYNYVNVGNKFYVGGSTTTNFITAEKKDDKDFLLFSFELNGNSFSENEDEIRNFGGAYDDVVKSLIIDENNDLVILGDTRSFKNTQDIDQILIKTDLEFNVYKNWLENPRLYGSESDDSAVKLLNSNDALYFLGTIMFSPENDNSVISFFKVNKNGRLTF